jgi:predicted AAA+ superfamily ATPase
MEIVKYFLHRRIEPRIWFWRTSSGLEVDFIVEEHGRLIPVETKLSATPRPGMASEIRSLRKDMGDKVASGYIIHPGDIRLPLGPDVVALPFAEM